MSDFVKFEVNSIFFIFKLKVWKTIVDTLSLWSWHLTYWPNKQFFPFYRSITWHRLVNIGRKTLMLQVLSENQLLTLGHGDLNLYESQWPWPIYGSWWPWPISLTPPPTNKVLSLHRYIIWLNLKIVRNESYCPETKCGCHPSVLHQTYSRVFLS